MATDYRFAIRCWQDSAGSEDAKINIFVDSSQVATDVVVTATSSSSPQVVSFEATGLPDPNTDGSVTCAIKVVLSNEYYVDASTDRNVWIDAIAHLPKDSTDNIYDGALNNPVTNFSDLDEYSGLDSPDTLPTAVTGDQIPSDFWSDAIANEAFYHIPVWGNSNDSSAGTTITIPLVILQN